MKKLSVLLPVHNAQELLAADAADLLEILAEIAGRFELVILDDGSTDETAETARDLAARYPQIRVIRHPLRLGLAEAIQTALDDVEGDIILLGDEDYCLDPDDLRTLWKLRDAQRRTAPDGAPSAAGRDGRFERLLAWRGPSSRARRNFQIIERRAFEQLRSSQAAEIERRVDAARVETATAIARRHGQPKFLKTAVRLASDN